MIHEVVGLPGRAEKQIHVNLEIVVHFHRFRNVSPGHELAAEVQNPFPAHEFAGRERAFTFHTRVSDFDSIHTVKIQKETEVSSVMGQETAEYAPPARLLEMADKLNEMLHLDPNAIDWLLKFHVKTIGDGLVHHPTVQVRLNPGGLDGKKFFSVGMLGVLNGLFCEPPYYLVAVYDPDFTVSQFRIDRL